MGNLISEMLAFGFLRRALLVGVLVSLCLSLLGVSLVLKRYSMIGDGLSHVGFGALSIALVANLSPLMVAIPVVTITAFLLLRISESSRMGGDAAIALISSSALALGVVVTALSTGLNADVHSYLFGSILAMSQSDVIVAVALSVVVILLYLTCYHHIFAITFDEAFARATGLSVGVYQSLIAILTAITVVVGMRMMGALLISSLIIFPALSAMRLFCSFRSVVLCAAGVSIACFLLGLFASYRYNTPAGASVVLANLLIFLLFALVGKLLGRTK